MKALHFALVPALVLGFASNALAQRPPAQLDSAAILHRIHKLDVLGSVLYIAAHPDDENTRLISYFSNGRKVRTAYLSLTRGDGGQNLIGPELGDALGIIRTQELLEARRIDGGEQFFTRAVDFGYSKSPEESFAKWGRDEVLSDVVRVVRQFRPDVIITRFDTDGSGGHGHHTASAILAREAFVLAADPQAFPEQLQQGLEIWQTKRLFFNGSTWWRKDLADVAAKDPAKWAAVDVGGFDPLLGISYTELAGKSRSQHKSQGFGAAETRGEQLDYLRLDLGAPVAGNDVFAGIVTGWERLRDGDRARDLVRALVENYSSEAPERSIAALSALARTLDAHAASDDPERAWARRKSDEARQLILQACGTVVEATTSVSRAADGDTWKVSLSALQRRSGVELDLKSFNAPNAMTIPVSGVLELNRPLTKSFDYTIGSAHDIDQPYWLAAPHAGLYPRGDGDYFGIEPASLSTSRFSGTLRLADGLEIQVDRALMNTWVDRVAGERTQPAVVTPLASVEVLDPVIIVRGERAVVTVVVEALRDNTGGVLNIELPAGWSISAPPAPVEPMRRGQRQELSVGLLRSTDAVAGTLSARFEGADGHADKTLHLIDHPHILPQVWYTPAAAQLLPLEVNVSVQTVGYIDGAGDGVASALRRLGVNVEHIDPATATAADLAKCDAIVTGIRAYNTVSALTRIQPLLLTFVEKGGTLLVQYSTNGSDLVMNPREIGPHPFTLTRDRVTVEEAPPTFLAPDHSVLNTPNVITAADFDGWVQERGLYFAGELDAHYTPLIAWNDPGEKPLQGGLIVCDHGQGRFIYAGLSLFRQLPAGVPGAYRLTANLIARRTRRE